MLINGSQIAQELLHDLKKCVDKLKKRGITPSLAVIRVGDDPSVASDINQKKKMAEVIGARLNVYQFPLKVKQEELLLLIEKLNSDTKINGIIVQLPLPKHLSENKLVEAVDPKKDVDGFRARTSFNVPVAAAVLEILKEVLQYFHLDQVERAEGPHTKKIELQIDGMRFLGSARNDNINFFSWLKKQNIVILGKGKTAGKPIADLLKRIGCKPVVIDSRMLNTKKLMKAADIIISAVGKAAVVKPDDIKQDVILIGIGLHRGGDGKFHGDYDEEKIKDIASFYTPTPRGVGPVNVAKLMENLVMAAEDRLKLNN